MNRSASTVSSETNHATNTEATQFAPRSEVLLDEWVAPEIADEREQLRTAKILEWMDVVGVLAAAHHGRPPVVTAAPTASYTSTPSSCRRERVT